uniref:SIMPL domain-containing protein n=1 Tax=Parerythrobacter lutipelagi TaxID=1964208 RepID=UPI0013759BF0|nr:SIMPL domain-containing protein [Parerythrobacter lutipelagi]
MKNLFLAAAAGLAILSVPASAQSVQGLGILALDPVDEGNTVLTLNGEGEVRRAPDLATFSAGVTTVGASAEEALRQNARTMQSLIAAVKRRGIADKDIQTSDISIRPIMSNDRGEEYLAIESYNAVEAAVMEVEAAAMEMPVGPRKKEPPKIVGYRVTNALTLRQRKLGDFGETIDALVGAGANTVDGPNFMIENSRDAENEARTKAIADARSRAELYAAAAGMRVVRIIMIDEGRTSGLTSRAPRNQFGFYQAMAEDYDSPTSVSPGELNISSRVGLMFELAPE